MPSPPPDIAQAASLDDVSVLCSCHTSSMHTPAGEITVVRVFGDVDLSTEHVLRAALTAARRRRPSHLVVDVAGLGFCSVRGLALLALAPTEPAALRAEYLLSGVEPHMQRHLGLLGPASTLPVRYPSAAAAVLAAMAQQRERHRHHPPTAHPDGLRAVRDPDRHDGVTDDELTERARGGDSAAYRELARRHRTRMYRSALGLLSSSTDPAHVAHDIATRLRLALAAFGEANPP